jgi:TonB family protein
MGRRIPPVKFADQNVWPRHPGSAGDTNMRLPMLYPIVGIALLIVVSQAAPLPILPTLPEMERQQPSQPLAPRSNSDPLGKFHVGDGVSAPSVVFGPTPEFTDKAIRKKIKGTVVVSLTVDVAGKPQNVRISRSLAEGVSKKLRSTALNCDEKVIEAVKQYRFKPAEFRGKPVPVETTIGISFGIY